MCGLDPIDSAAFQGENCLRVQSLVFADIFLPDIRMLTDVFSHHRKAFSGVQVDDLYAERAQPFNAALEIPAEPCVVVLRKFIVGHSVLPSRVVHAVELRCSLLECMPRSGRRLHANFKSPRDVIGRMIPVCQRIDEDWAETIPVRFEQATGCAKGRVRRRVMFGYVSPYPAACAAEMLARIGSLTRPRFTQSRILYAPAPRTFEPLVRGSLSIV
jgi:hypothetical protein